MILVKSLKGSGSLTKGVSKSIKNEAKEQKVASLLLGTIGASLFLKSINM